MHLGRAPQGAPRRRGAGGEREGDGRVDDRVDDRDVDYGLDAPEVFRRLLLVGLAGLTAGAAAAPRGGRWGRFLGLAAAAVGAAALGLAGSSWWSSRIGKRRLRQRLLDAVAPRGGERVLDVGCGRGLLLLGAAARLGAGGRAVGVDVWSERDQGRNRPAATVANARRAGVADRVAVVSGDARDLPFATGRFDVVVSSLALHNIPSAAGRERAIGELVRVLAPGGRVGIFDIRATDEYARALAARGLEVERRGPHRLFAVATWIVMARRPAAPVGAPAG